MNKAIVFGATSGIGKELATQLNNSGYRVAITGRRENLLNEISSNSNHAGHLFTNQNQVCF